MYQALYRKYRPMSFADVVSQPQVTQTLLNQLKTGRTAHAYIFTGSRGTGKTTCARILAKAMNCLHPVDGNPCLECEICRDADEGVLGDIIEIDAASNSGVDDIRDLREGTVYMPERCKYKVYIIDEVHMLSPAAFNALLKIMEEPPEHVKFILATTEIHKVLPTILSRCQRFDFHRIKSDDIAKRLLRVAEQENFTLTDEAALLIAKASDGGMRDALSLLDRCTAYSDNITEDVAASAAGIAGSGPVFRILEAAAEHNTAEAVKAVGELYDSSKDMQQLCAELVGQLRNVMLAKTVPDDTGILNCLPSETAQVKSLAEKMPIGEIFTALEILQETGDRIGRVPSKRVEIEMCMIKLCTNRPSAAAQADNSIDNSEIYAKIDMLERRLGEVSVQPSAARTAAVRNEPIRRSSPQQDRQSAEAAPSPSKTDQGKLDPSSFKPVERWAEILDEYRAACPSGSAALVGSYALESGDLMLIFSENSFFMSVLKAGDNAEKLKRSIQKITGRIYNIRAKCTNKTDKTDAKQPLESIIKKAQENGIPTEQS
ncbi:MAG: DNA polymerase III subunit gamma/tau [Oscillospiraceae bacterium]